jgi:hypothetical protein
MLEGKAIAVPPPDPMMVVFLRKSGHSFSLRLTYTAKQVNLVCSLGNVILSPPSLRRLVEKEVIEESPDGVCVLRTWKASSRLLM